MTKKRNYEQEREYARKKRDEGQGIVELPCKLCGTPTITKEYKVQHHVRKGGITCRECVNRLASKKLQELQASLSPEERSQRAKKANTKINKSAAVEKQWRNIRSDPDKFREVCDARSARMKDVWEKYDEEQKNYIVGKLVAAHGKSRSMISEQLKHDMTEAGLYEGFISEQVFHGFVVDEINYDLKLIVEMFGDLYHCNPRKYKDPGLFIRAIQRKVGEQWERDRRRLACFYKHGYSTIVVWEKEFRQSPSRVIERIRNEIDKKRGHRSTGTMGS